ASYRDYLLGIPSVDAIERIYDIVVPLSWEGGVKFSFALICRPNGGMALCVADYIEKQICP
ncbi:hypothetical protein, partial [Porphyromonas loveana]|uniref:hypothetical protein n=1 Tax=Porphyromonas loveana TaxID=1884669 RepID=UPI0035A1A69B